MSSSWSTPDPRRAGRLQLPASLPSPPEAPGAARPSLRDDALAGVLAAVVTVLLAAPVGLLWAATAPTVLVRLSAAGVSLTVPSDPAFIAGDGFFVGVTAVAGLVGGLVAGWLARRHGPAVVVGLAVGGLLAAYVAVQVGQQVGREEVEAAVATGREGLLELNLRLRAQEALVAWPFASLVGLAAVTAARRRSAQA